MGDYAMGDYDGGGPMHDDEEDEDLSKRIHGR